jgi:hypothetical protein
VKKLDALRKRRERIPLARPGVWVAVRCTYGVYLPVAGIARMDARWQLWDVELRTMVAEVSRLELPGGEVQWHYGRPRTLGWHPAEEGAMRAAEALTGVRPWSWPSWT